MGTTAGPNLARRAGPRRPSPSRPALDPLHTTPRKRRLVALAPLREKNRLFRAPAECNRHPLIPLCVIADRNRDDPYLAAALPNLVLFAMVLFQTSSAAPVGPCVRFNIRSLSARPTAGIRRDHGADTWCLHRQTVAFVRPCPLVAGPDRAATRTRSPPRLEARVRQPRAATSRQSGRHQSHKPSALAGGRQMNRKHGRHERRDRAFCDPGQAQAFPGRGRAVRTG
jgi:hypothetical protein